MINALAPVTANGLAGEISDLIAYAMEDSQSAVGVTIVTNQPLNGYSANGLLGGPPATFSYNQMRAHQFGAITSLRTMGPRARYWSIRGWTLNPNPPCSINSAGNGGEPFSPQQEDTDQAGLRIVLLPSGQIRISYLRYSDGGGLTSFPVSILGYYTGTPNGVLIYGIYGNFRGFITISLWEAKLQLPES